MLNVFRLGAVLTARDMMSRGFSSASRGLRSLSRDVDLHTGRMDAAFRRARVGVGLFTAGLVGVGGSFALANQAGDFEHGLAAVGAVTSATTSQLRGLSDAALQAGVDTQFSPTEATEGLLSLATAGQTAAQSTRTLIPVLDLAAGSLGQLGVAQSAEAVVGTLNAYGMAADDAASVTDRLLRITQLTNFQTRDFEAGLAKAAAAGSTFNQPLNDVLITMGLLRNRNIDASSASTAFRESIRRVASDARAQRAVLRAGVDIYDQQTGRIRALSDIMSDFAERTAQMSEAERNRLVAQAFGARGMLAFNAIQQATFTTMRDGREVVLRGRDAIAALREQMSRADGTAAQFRRRMLSTFEGQKTLLKGSLQTLLIVLGRPFATAFAPIVGAVVKGLNLIIRFVQAIPDPVKNALAGLFVAGSAFVALAGSVIAGKAAIALFVIGLQAIGVTLGSVLATLAPVLLGLGAVAASIPLFRAAFERNLGGVRDFVYGTVAKVRLAWNALRQLFRDGGFSGEVRKDMANAEHRGVRRFVVSIFKLVHRAKRLWKGFRSALSEALDRAAPTFARFTGALRSLGRTIGGIWNTLVGGASDLSSDKFESFGGKVGAALGWLAEKAVAFLSGVVEFTDGLVQGVRDMWPFIRPIFERVVGAARELWKAFSKLFSGSGEAADGSGASLQEWGRRVGTVLGVVVMGVGLFLESMITATRWSVQAFTWMKDHVVSAGTRIWSFIVGVYEFFTVKLPAGFRRAGRAIGDIWTSIKDTVGRVARALGRAVGNVGESMRAVFGGVRDFFNGIVTRLRNTVARIWNFIVDLVDQIPNRFLPGSLESLQRIEVVPLQSSGTRAQAATDGGGARSPAAVEARGRGEAAGGVAELARALAQGQRARAQQPPTVIRVELDGQVAAEAVHDANRDAADRGFTPVPVFG